MASKYIDPISLLPKLFVRRVRREAYEECLIIVSHAKRCRRVAPVAQEMITRYEAASKLAKRGDAKAKRFYEMLCSIADEPMQELANG